MAVEPRKRPHASRAMREDPAASPLTSLVQLDHLLKVAGSVSQDANKVWAEIWGELKRLTAGGDTIVPEAEAGFVPECGWPEFLEKVWLLKHYLDSIQRICDRKH